MTTIFTCYRGSTGGRSVELSRAYQEKGYRDVTFFDGGAQRMATLTTDELAHEVVPGDTVVFIVDDWGSMDPQRKDYAAAEGLVSLLRGVQHKRTTSLKLMQILDTLPRKTR